MDFLVALAHMTAPFFETVERLEELESDNERLRIAERKVAVLIGSSEAMVRVKSIINVVAPSPQPVLVLGETGTGKELVAVLLHELSGRTTGPLVTVNCAAIPHDLFESEFFGHEKGAFTGATHRKVGLIEQSRRGTLFLDEIGDLSLDHQARILRAIETGQFRRIGGGDDIQVDFRVVAATNKNLVDEIKRGRFREDLYHRVNGIQIHIPPLRDRQVDIPELLGHFLEMACASVGRPGRRFTPRAVKYLVNQLWPGNVRQLKSIIEAAVVMSQKKMIDVDTLRAMCGTQEVNSKPLPLAEIEKIHIQKTLTSCGGNVVKTADVLGISKSALYNKLAQYGVKR